MDVFDANGKLVRGYQRFSESYVSIRNRIIEARVREEGGFRWPEARLALNPTFATGETVDDLIGRDLLHPECGWIFRDRNQDPSRVPMDLYPHQVSFSRRDRVGLTAADLRCTWACSASLAWPAVSPAR